MEVMRMKKMLLVLTALGIMGTALQSMAFNINAPFVTTWAVLSQKTARIDYPGDKDYFVVTLRAGVTYKITLNPPFYADFDLYVFDENLNLVGYSRRGSGLTETVYITPRWTGRFYIAVVGYSGTGSYVLKLWS